MPPKRSASTSKRKLSSSPEEDQPDTATKRAKIGGNVNAKGDGSAGDAAGAGIGPNGQPTNKVMPVQIRFPKKAAGTLRIASWNICGLAASQKKGFKYYVEAEDPDILVLTETKINDEPVDPTLTKRYPYRYWSISEKKTYSGTSILSKHEPLSVTKHLPGHPEEGTTKGRIVTLEFKETYVVGTYVVNAGEKLKTMDAKKLWQTHFEAYLRSLDAKKSVIWVGDLNVAPEAIDLANPQRNWNKTPGYTEIETSWFKNVLNPSGNTDADSEPKKFVDVWRHLHPGLRHYTYFSYRFNARMKGLGWRLDMFVLSERILRRVKMCEIRSECYGASDHVPIVMDIEGEL
ncbi:hypothetical protein PUNSTDRAFT_121434 [Punctularia strigosozonata HHB-11173 SS5]|uniref:uncharacterized protein n=1 Tax=Punctularia strigosozonata (strain HHB-11173) TaxID=741275 RepID=UPI00044179E2|nr:uncharacterized protein PUNSTDRAFT_121434 [Punctularia strigosozonata HHB-11173 SS5]EIN07274.1 hypothetical protein PUNSTDRAFT_121434 [Punctularia strigosozonata HHB-11173 SS5]